MQSNVHLNGKVFYHNDVEIYSLQYFLINVCLARVIVLPLLGLVNTKEDHDVCNSLMYHVIRGHLHVLH